jgi:hypothetical protein
VSLTGTTAQMPFALLISAARPLCVLRDGALRTPPQDDDEFER